MTEQEAVERERKAYADGLRAAANYLAQGATINLGGIEDRLTPEEFSRAFMTAIQMFSEELHRQADSAAARRSA